MRRVSFTSPALLSVNLSRAGIPLLPVVLCFRAESEEDHLTLFAGSGLFS
jgi:hypothetical protein